MCKVGAIILIMFCVLGAESMFMINSRGLALVPIYEQPSESRVGPTNDILTGTIHWSRGGAIVLTRKLQNLRVGSTNFSWYFCFLAFPTRSCDSELFQEEKKSHNYGFVTCFGKCAQLSIYTLLSERASVIIVSRQQLWSRGPEGVRTRAQDDMRFLNAKFP